MTATPSLTRPGTRTGTRTPDTPPSLDRRSRSWPSSARHRFLGVVGFVLAVFYALFVRFYQAAGGTVGLEFAPPVGFAWASYVAGLLVLVGGTACLVLTQPGLRTVPSWFPVGRGVTAPRWLVIVCCAAPTMVATVVTVSHGVGGEVAKGLEALGLGTASIHADAPPSSRAALLWELAFYEPWFIAFGVCMGVSVLGYLHQAEVAPRTIRVVASVLAAASVACAVIVVLAMMLHQPLMV